MKRELIVVLSFIAIFLTIEYYLRKQHIGKVQLNPSINITGMQGGKFPVNMDVDNKFGDNYNFVIRETDYKLNY